MASEPPPPFATDDAGTPPPTNDVNASTSRQTSSIGESESDAYLDAFSSEHSLPFATVEDEIDDDDDDDDDEPLFPPDDEEDDGQEDQTEAEAGIPPTTQDVPTEVESKTVEELIDNLDEFSIGDDDDDDIEKDTSPPEMETESALPAFTDREMLSKDHSSSPPASPVDFDDVDISDKDITNTQTTDADEAAAEAAPPEPMTASNEMPDSTPNEKSTTTHASVPETGSILTLEINEAPDSTADEKTTTTHVAVSVPETGSGESWEPIEDDATMNNAIQYEILPGLWAHMSDDAVVGFHDMDSYAQSDDDCQHFDILISAKKVCLGCGSFLLGKDVAGDGYFLMGRDVTVRAQLEKPRAARDEWDIVVRDLDISIAGGMELDPLADRAQVVSFLEKFGCRWSASSKTSDNHPSNKSASKQQTLPARRMTKEEWQQFLRNVRDDKKAREANVKEDCYEDDSQAQNLARDRSSIDFLVPYVKVWEVPCKLSKERTINFPHCEGTAKCTLRTLLEYYCRSMLNTIDDASGGNAELDGKSSVADVTAVKASIVGAAAGAAVLGPIGFLAGSYLGSHLGRKHSGTVVGATAGACLFGPVGLIAGACYGESTRNLSRGGERPPAFGQFTTDSGGIAKAATEHVSSNKYEYAGTAGVVAGAAAGSVAGAIGMVAGAYLGSVSARKVTENASSAAAEVSETEGRRQYRFGDVTRGLVARGKQARGADRNEGYQFGDFTRGLFSGGKAK